MAKRCMASCSACSAGWREAVTAAAAVEAAAEAALA